MDSEPLSFFAVWLYHIVCVAKLGFNVNLRRIALHWSESPRGPCVHEGDVPSVTHSSARAPLPCYSVPFLIFLSNSGQITKKKTKKKKRHCRLHSDINLICMTPLMCYTNTWDMWVSLVWNLVKVKVGVAAFRRLSLFRKLLTSLEESHRRWKPRINCL